MSDKRKTSISFDKKSENVNLNEPEQPSDGNDENAQLSMAPHVQTYLAQISKDSGCWGKCLPIPFERAAKKSWWDPTFDSEILEEQFKKSANAHNKLKFRYALCYVLALSILWFIYFLSTGIITGIQHWPVLCVVLATFTLSVIIMLFITNTEFYHVHMLKVSLMVALGMCMLNLTFLVLLSIKTNDSNDFTEIYMSPAGQFALFTEILLLIYTIIPMRLYMCITIGIIYSLAFELLTWFLHDETYKVLTILVRLLCHICIHFIGLHILIMTNVRMRNTFMKVGQSLLVRRQLESEKKLKENMIHSLMPPSVAHWLLNDDENFTKNGMEPRNSNPETNDIQSLFRPFNMNRMENVSILFADIVGFTKMSSTKTAEELVEILNNLFQRFDLLCKFHNCEKISTLGDCYYCVSGCPEPRVDHGKCCTEMGLSMIQAIKQFDQEKSEGVNMRVGVHTGTILCGIVGTRRFKFDVWSNDVTLANRMESTGKPGMVHISEKTLEFLPDIYYLDEGEPVFGLKTFFILGKKSDRPPSYNGSFRGEKVQNNSLQLIISPPTSPPSMSPQTRPRVLSCDTTSCFMKPIHNPNTLSPDVCKIKANSLPSILDSENEQETENDKEIGGGNDSAKTPTSTSSSTGRYSVKIKNWKLPKFLRKNEQKDVEASDAQTSSNCEELISGYQQVPTIIETQNSTSVNGKSREQSWLNIDQLDDDRNSAFYLEEQKDTIDVKSYISQSRSDVGQYDYSPHDFSHFIRTGSYRSQYGRSPNEFSYLTRAGSNRSRRGRSPNFDFIPTERSRSATVAVGQLERPKKSVDNMCRLSAIFMDDHLSTAQSVNSRKDSGIKSNSRRSSIIQIENQPSQMDQNNHQQQQQHRVSGYYTSSQSSINSPQYASRLPGPFLGKCIQRLRKQSDRQLIKCVQDNSKSNCSYFMKPPLSKISLFFIDKKTEQEYRANVHSVLEQHESIPTLANSRFSTYFDVFVSSVIFLIVSLSLFLVSEISILWISTFFIFIFIQICAVASCFNRFASLSERLFFCCSNWYRWNAFGGVLVSLPLIAVIVNFSCSKDLLPKTMSDYLYTYLLFIGTIHFCNFTQLNCWMKNILATCFAMIYMCLILSGYCYENRCLEKNDYNRSNYTFNNIYYNDEILNKTNSEEYHQRKNFLYDYEIFIDLLLLLILVWLLNREFEIGYRLSFHAHFVANRDKIHVQSLKNQADWLIYNIVPEHVADQLKKNAKYSENFNNVAIIFASIVNFNEMYDESYLGGKEFLRVLNELIGDFDELLTLPEFQSVEKIKTIGSTFMAASGLNSKMRLEQENPNEHLFALMDFAIAMQNVIDNFNRDLLEFNLILRIGYNFGDVTAAVIGKTKLYYDIWGDAVNIASRMDTTGVNSRIQVGEHCLKILEERYTFEKRGSIFVKGKDNMNVYFLLHKKDPDQNGIS